METNILQNSSFDSAWTGWVKTNHVELVTNNDARNGGTSVKLTAIKGEGFTSISQYFEAQPGESYVLSFWARGPEDLQLTNSFGYIKATGTWWSNGTSHIFGNNENTNYRRFTRQYVFPADMSSTRVYIRISAAAAMIDEGEAFVDDIEVYKQDFPSDINHPAGVSYLNDQSFEKDSRCSANFGVVVDPLNARTGYKALKLSGNHIGSFTLSSAPVGNAYTASFYAKTDSTATKVGVRYNFTNADGNSQINMAGYTPELTSTYQRYEIRMPIPSNAQAVGNIHFHVSPQSTSKIAWIDDCKIVKSSIPFYTGNLVKTTVDNVYVREEATRSSNGKKVSIGCTLPIIGYAEGETLNETNLLVKVKWCVFNNGSFTVTSRYIHSSFVEEIINLNPSQKLSTMITIAKSLVGTKGGDLNLKGSWCQTLLYWLCYIADMNMSRIPVHLAVTAAAVNWLNENNMYVDHTKNSDFLPYPGCWIYYLNVGSTDNMSHVGLVVNRIGTALTCVEGNLGSGDEASRVVQLVEIDDCTADTVTVNGQQKYIMGYGTIHYT